MRFKKQKLKFVLDEGVPNAVGEVLKAAGHAVIFGNKSLPRSSPDVLVCAFAEWNDAILVALDGDMKVLAKGHGITNSRFKKLSLIKLSCREPEAAARVSSALTLIEHEWHFSPHGGPEGRRIFIEIMTNVIRTTR